MLSFKDYLTEDHKDVESLASHLKSKYPLDTLHLGSDGSNVDIHRIDVKKEHQGKGVGSKVINHISDWAKKHGHKSVSLVSNVEHKKGKSGFYDKLGFKKTHRGSSLYRKDL